LLFKCHENKDSLELGFCQLSWHYDMTISKWKLITILKFFKDVFKI